MASRRDRRTVWMSTRTATASSPANGSTKLVRQPGPIADRRFDIEFLDPGVEAFVFTFG